MRPFRIASIVLALTALVGAPSAQEGRPQPLTPEFRASTALVSVDVVVRDGRGRPVLDLTASDFEVLEDGVRQEITSFLAPPDAAPPSSLPSGAASRESSRVGSTPSGGTEHGRAGGVALVFDRLDAQPRKMAYDAAKRFVESGGADGQPIGVFVIDASLVVAQDFTRDRARVLEGLDKAVQRAPWMFTHQLTPGAESDAERALRVAAPPVPQGGPVWIPGQSVVDDTGTAGSRGKWEGLDTGQIGGQTMRGLRAIVSALSAAPGRKNLVLFSAGLPVSRQVEPQFHALMVDANLANVSFYAVDAEGLRAVSTQTLTGMAVRSSAQTSLDCAPGECGGMNPLAGGRDAQLFDPSATLGRIARETGGFLAANRNDFDRGLARLDSDLRSHYLLTYSSTNEAVDGTDRRITVRVARRGVGVVARRGYRASPVAAGRPVLAFESAAIAALDALPVPNAFAHTLRAVRFAGSRGSMRLGVLAEIATRDIIPLEPVTSSSAAVDAVVLARVRDGNGRVLMHTSQQYLLRADGEHAATLRDGRILFFRVMDIPAGAYTVETAVHDRASGRASVRFASVDVPALPDHAPRLGDVFVVGNVEDVSASTEHADGVEKEADAYRGHPLRFGSSLLYPRLGTTVARESAGAELAFAFTATGTDRVVSATVEVWKEGALSGTVALPLGPPEPDGVVRQVFRVPADAFADGANEVRVLFRSPEAELTRTVRFTLAGSG